MKIFYTMKSLAPKWPQLEHSSLTPWEKLAPKMRSILCTNWGRLSLAQKSNAVDDLNLCIINTATDEQMPDVIEAWIEAARMTGPLPVPTKNVDALMRGYRELINEILDDYDIAFQVVAQEIIPRDSMVLHANVIEPALSLLHGRDELAGVEKAFQASLNELKPGGDPADAITDAATALQEMLVAVGAVGNSLGPLLQDARKKGLLGPYDSKLAEGVEKIGEWVSADRSTRGDAHATSEATRADAWLAVHVAGAMIARLEARMHGK